MNRQASPHPGGAAIVGAAQVVQRPRPGADLATACGPIELMVEACREAAVDAGVPSLLARVGWIGVAGGFFRFRNPGSLIAREIGADARCALSAVSGSAPQEMLGLAAARIVGGELDVALVVGGEARWTTGQLKRQQAEPRWITEPGDGAVEAVSGFPDELAIEGRIFGGAPPAYALMEDALRVSLGRTVRQHHREISALWARFSEVAAGNPYAWDRTAHTAGEIGEPSLSNRMISFPYTKAMVANNTVDLASAVLLCRADLAIELGVDRDAMVFPHVVTTSHETWRVASRPSLSGLPAVRAAGERALELAGVGVDDLDHIDLYACFPSVVQMTARELGIDLNRRLTVTGGLGFAGAAVGNAVGQSIAAMVPLVREGGYGLVHGNGGMATKHSFGVYSGAPPGRFVMEDCQHLVGDDRCGDLPTDHTGLVELEAATVVFDREGPSHAIVGVRAGDRRRWVRTGDEEVMAAVTGEGIAGGQAELLSDERLVVR